jgi:MarR family transcriptional regulator, organic hydroperoxide resistance regulator
MDYETLAKKMLSKMFALNKTRPQRSLNEEMRGEGFVMQFIVQHEGAVLPSEISNFMDISTARMAAALGNLERKGLVTRRIDPSDRRRILVDLTDAGKSFAHEKQELMLRHTTQLLERLGERDAEDLLRLLDRVEEIMTDLHTHC